MFIFNKERKNEERDKIHQDVTCNRGSVSSKVDVDNVNDNAEDKKKKKRIRIGFGRRRHREIEEKKRVSDAEKKITGLTDDSLGLTEENTDEDGRRETERILDVSLKTMDDGLADEVKHEEPDKQRRAALQRGVEGKPVYLEDTGEKLGVVHSVIYDREDKPVGYRIKDVKSDAILSFTIDHFDVDKNGLIFIPSWYTSAIRIIDKLEFKDRISPEITALLVDDALPAEELYDIFLKHDEEMAEYIDEAVALKESLTKRLQILERQRLALKNSLMDLTEKRLIKDIDRRRFTEEVMDHRRRANILDVNIKKCKELLQRLEKTSFGMIEKLRLPGERGLKRHHKEMSDEDKWTVGTSGFNESDYIYKQKYYELKERYNKLKEEYNELKNAVEKIMLQKDEGV